MEAVLTEDGPEKKAGYGKNGQTAFDATALRCGVTPAKAGVQLWAVAALSEESGIPAFAGMTASKMNPSLDFHSVLC
jgi:hypothetical protein